MPSRIGPAQIAVLGLGLWGCATPTDKGVYVDLERIALPSAKHRSQPPESFKNLPAVPQNQAVGFDSQSATEVKVRPLGTGNLSQELATERSKALKVLSARLLAVYEKSVDIDWATQSIEIETRRSTALATIEQKIHPLLEKAGIKRLKASTTIGGFVGFPDRGSNSNLLPKQIALVEEARQALKDANKDLLNGIEAEYRAIDARYQSDITALKLRRADKMASARRQVQQEAERQLGNIQTDKRYKMNGVVIRANEMPRISGTIESPSIAKVPQLKPVVQPEYGSLSKADLLSIWSAESGYTVKDKRASARDATEEFQRWILTHHLGN